MLLHFLQPGKLQSKKDMFSACDFATLEHLKELSSRRRVIKESINQSSFITEAIAREMFGGLTSRCLRDLQKLEQYLQLLENLIFHDDLELGMTLYLHVALLQERAIEILPADLVQSATLFREAAGVFQHLANGVFPSLQYAQSVEQPPEATPSMCTVMSLVCLAKAQAVTIRKAEEKGTIVGLLAKLHYGIVELLGEATAILYSNTKECKNFSLSFLEFISSCKALHELRSQKYLAESLKIAEQVGVAIGVLSDALINAKKEVPGEESWRSIFRKEVDKSLN
ncbi:hypothetical protein V6N13_099364 [Hibiscus sabdariffa]|uniref:BRO1 domain-containing protein n=1 Tax=Hibiscus sabdariffa TaxID=183260 RepID=A0ABR2PZM9_9ROSI